MGQKYKTVCEMKRNDCWNKRHNSVTDRQTDRQTHPQVNGQLTVTQCFRMTFSGDGQCIRLGRGSRDGYSAPPNSMAGRLSYRNKRGAASWGERRGRAVARHSQCSVISFQKPSGVAAAGSNLYPCSVKHQHCLWLHCISSCIKAPI